MIRQTDKLKDKYIYPENAFITLSGKFYEDKAFKTNEEELNEFEKHFPKKEKGKPKIDINH